MKKIKKTFKKVLTKGKVNDIIARHSAKKRGGKKKQNLEVQGLMLEKILEN